MSTIKPGPTPDDAPLDASVAPPEIKTPVIDIQDVEHKPGPRTRVSNKGVRIPPPLDSDHLRDFAKEDEDALVALEQIEKALRGQLPG
jgi:hypothetical protein